MGGRDISSFRKDIEVFRNGAGTRGRIRNKRHRRGAETKKVRTAGYCGFSDLVNASGKDDAVGQATAMEKSEPDGRGVHEGFEDGKIQAGGHAQPQGETSPIALLEVTLRRWRTVRAKAGEGMKVLLARLTGRHLRRRARHGGWRQPYAMGHDERQL